MKIGPVLEAEVARGGDGILLEHLRAGDVGGHEVGRELDALALQLERIGERAGHQRFREAGRADEETVAAAKERDEDLIHDLGLADDDARHFGADALHGLVELRDGGLGVVEDDGLDRRRLEGRSGGHRAWFRAGDFARSGPARRWSGRLKFRAGGFSRHGESARLAGRMRVAAVGFVGREFELRVADGKAGAGVKSQIGGGLVVVVDRDVGVVGGHAPVALVLRQVGVMGRDGGVVDDDVAGRVGADDERLVLARQRPLPAGAGRG